MVNINSLNQEVRDALNDNNYQGSVSGGYAVNRNASPPISQYTGHNQTNNNFSGRRGRRNAIVPGDIPGNFRDMQQDGRQRANTQVPGYEGETGQMDNTTHPL
jgi:hypothetical protein